MRTKKLKSGIVVQYGYNSKTKATTILNTNTIEENKTSTWYKGYLITENPYASPAYPATQYVFVNTNNCDEVKHTASSIDECIILINEIIEGL